MKFSLNYKHIWLLAWVSITVFTNCASHQNLSGWSEDNRTRYNNVKNLCKYLSSREINAVLEDRLYQYIYMDYVLLDTVVERKEERLQAFNGLIISFKHYIDSVGVKNLDAVPLSEKVHSEYYRIFTAQEDITWMIPYTFIYFKKNDPHADLGALFFHPDSKKLTSWILINNGGRYWFLTFNLL